MKRSRSCTGNSARVVGKNGLWRDRGGCVEIAGASLSRGLEHFWHLSAASVLTIVVITFTPNVQGMRPTLSKMDSPIDTAPGYSPLDMIGLY